MVSFVSRECLGNMDFSVLFRGNGKLGAAFGTALSKDLASRSRLRADEESVGLCALALLWLIRE